MLAVRFSSKIAPLLIGTLLALQGVSTSVLGQDDATLAVTIEGADRLRLTGRYEEAAEQYRQLKLTEPESAAIGLARCLLARGKMDAAEAILREAGVASPQSAILPGELALLEFGRGDYREAQKLTDSALQLDENQLSARWVSAELHRTAGRLVEAQQAYRWLVLSYNREQQNITNPDDLHTIGLAAAQYARWVRSSQQFSFLVNTLYPDALKIEENYWPAHLESALLFLEKYNEADAAHEINAALAINPNAAEIYVAKAMLALQKYDLQAADAAIDRALQINPQLLSALRLKADVFLRMTNQHVADAMTVLEQARRLNEADEDTLGRLAAAYGLADALKDDPAETRMGAIIDEAVNRNRHCGRFFLALASTLDAVQKYPQAVTYYEEAQRRMPQLVTVRGQLGMMYMRLGEEVKAAELLEESFKIDPFNVRVKNSLAVLDLLQGYAVLETDHFVIRFDRGVDELLARYAARYLEEEVYPTLVKELNFTPPEKSLFEIFSRSGSTSGHGWFSARMVGLPYIGTVGACAGKMVAITSPTDMPEKFNWARVLRHEFVHVLNLQQTNFNIPHWYTEGLAVWYEGLPRPPSWDQILALRARNQTLLDLNRIDIGFLRPSSGDEWTLAYCQAELYVQYMHDMYGKESLAKLLAAYGDGLTTPQAIRRCFGVDLVSFEADYLKYVDGVVASLTTEAAQVFPSLVKLQSEVKENPKNAEILAQLAYAYLQRGDKPTARRWAVEAQKIEAKQQLAGYVLARLYLSIGDALKAVEILEEVLDRNQPQTNTLALLAGLRLKAEQFAEAERLYQLGRKHFPRQTSWLKSLARVYLQSHDDPKLVGALTELAALDYDNFTIRKKLAQLTLQEEDYPAAQRWAHEAMRIDVMDAEVHALLGKSSAEQRQFTSAAEEYETAIRLDSRQLVWRLELADTYVQQGAKEMARNTLEELLKIDPQFPGADVLLESLQR